jgi:uncharacterized protein YjiK
MSQNSIIILLTILLAITCQQAADKQENQLDSYFEAVDNLRSTKLPKALNEISGLAMSEDGRLFAHNDEEGIVYQIDYTTGKIEKKFSLGKKKPPKKDFEGLAIVRDKFFLVTSDGDLYEFKEGDNNDNVEYEIHKTSLSSKNDVEGLCYDPETNALLLACKGYPGKGYKNQKAVYSFSLDNMKLNKKPRFLIPEKIFKEDSSFVHSLGDFFLLPVRKFAPSGIERHPLAGSFFVLSANGYSLIEVSLNGKIIGRIKLDSEIHHQSEGITFTSENILLISDEAAENKAKITSYNW